MITLTDSIMREVDLSGITVVDQDLAWFATVGDMLSSTASKQLMSALESQNQPEIVGALHVFYNMNTLAEKVQNFSKCANLHRYRLQFRVLLINTTLISMAC